MLDGSPVLRAPSIAAADVYRRRAAKWALAADVADEPAALQERFILLRVIGRVGPDARTGVRGFEQALAQKPAIMPAGVGALPKADQPKPPVDARVGLVP